MTLGASPTEIAVFGAIFLVGMGLGLLDLVLFAITSSTKSRTLRFIFDLAYAIIVGGVFVMALWRLCSLDIRYYHIIALTMGVGLVGVVPRCCLSRYENVIYDYFRRLRTAISETRLMHIVKK